MFFSSDFSLRSRGDVVFKTNELLYSFYISLGGLNVAISLVLVMFSQFHVFSQVRFL